MVLKNPAVLTHRRYDSNNYNHDGKKQNDNTNTKNSKPTVQRDMINALHIFVIMMMSKCFWLNILYKLQGSQR